MSALRPRTGTARGRAPATAPTKSKEGRPWTA